KKWSMPDWDMINARAFPVRPKGRLGQPFQVRNVERTRELRARQVLLRGRDSDSEVAVKKEVEHRAQTPTGGVERLTRERRWEYRSLVAQRGVCALRAQREFARPNLRAYETWSRRACSRLRPHRRRGADPRP